MPQRRPHCAHQKNVFKRTPFVLTFLGCLAMLSTVASPLLAAEDPYENRTPYNADEEHGWKAFSITNDFSTNEENLYFGAIGVEQQPDWKIVYINTAGEHRIQGNTIHIFARPRSVKTSWIDPLAISLSTRSGENLVNHTTWDAALIVDAEGAQTHDNQYPIVQGINLKNYTNDIYPNSTARTVVDFMKPVSIRVNNNSSLISRVYPILCLLC